MHLEQRLVQDFVFEDGIRQVLKATRRASAFIGIPPRVAKKSPFAG
jgi:hypothetical protein